jgi:type I restriction enzyme M protein
MRSGVDFLGKFYENFLRYGSDTKKIGIVFTPRHITRFCADLLDVKTSATVYDPACGTGGFLVAAFDRMMKDATTEAAKTRVRTSLYGSDTNATVWALSVLNMFFRGDGRSHINYGTCFDDKAAYHQKFDNVLLNPPFSQEGEPETDFIDHALSCLKPGGEMAVVVKTNVMVDPELSTWRKAMVENHHVLGVISLPLELFYPTAAPTVILIVRAHTPSKTIGTFLARINNDGFAISKKRRVEVAGSQLESILSLYRQFIQRQTVETIPNVACVVDRARILNGEEICAEQWLPSASYNLENFESRRHELYRQMSLAIANYPDIIDEILLGFEDALAEGPTTKRPPGRAAIKAWFQVSGGKSAGSKNYPGGEVPYISSNDTYNSIANFIDAPDDEVFASPGATVTGFGQAYIQPWRFTARGNGGSAVRILKPRFSMSLSELIWFVGQINSQRWRFNYGRMAIQSRVSELELDPPPANLPKITGLERRLRQFRKGIESLLDVREGDGSVESEFKVLAAEWKAEHGVKASVVKMAQHPAYQQIIELGEKVVPLLLKELEREPDHWFLALNKITGEDPVPSAGRGHLKSMADAWVSWGKKKGLLH